MPDLSYRQVTSSPCPPQLLSEPEMDILRWPMATSASQIFKPSKHYSWEVHLHSRPSSRIYLTLLQVGVLIIALCAVGDASTPPEVRRPACKRKKNAPTQPIRKQVFEKALKVLSSSAQGDAETAAI
ncbi:uncharacterized protein ISCGN_022589 [Ixodes scapularis]